MNLFQKGRSNKGQSTIEYILLVTAVIAVMIFFTTNRNSGVQQRVESSYNAVGDEMEAKAVTLGTSHTDTGAGGASPAPTIGVDVDNVGNMNLP